MKLIYRGTTYDYNPNFAKTDRTPQRTMPYELIYRGNRYQVDPTIVKVNAIEPCYYNLIYRGAVYQVSRNEFGKMTAITCSTKLHQCESLTPHATPSTVTNQPLL
jgi:hypothetical protein